MQIGQKMSFWNFINDPQIKRIKIPKIQRDYVQGRDDGKVEFSFNRLLGDVYKALSEGVALDLNYIYGKIDSYKNFVPIDGQQRLTTLLALHIYAFVKDGYSAQFKVLQEKFVYETRETTRVFLENLIENFAEYFTSKGYSDVEEYIKDSAWFSLSWERDPSVRSFLKVFNRIDEKFNSVSIADKLTASDCPITFMELRIDNMGNENDLYIKMNSRGKSLSDFEIFKSDLFDYVDDMVSGKELAKDFSEEFKRFADTKWMDLIWSMRDGQESDWDKHYVKLLHWLLLNRILPQTNGSYDDSHKKSGSYDDSYKKLIANEGFYNFDNYAKKLNRSGTKRIIHDKDAIDAIYATFEFLCRLQETDSALLFEIKDGVLKKAEEGEMRSRVILFAITKYALVKKDDWDIQSFKDWYRIVVNLVRNTEVDKEEKYCKACNEIDRLGATCLPDTLRYFANVSTGKAPLEFFDGYQQNEEILKAKLIVKNNDWYSTIVCAEQYGYFDRRIRFLFNLQDIDENNLLVDDKSIATFKENCEIAVNLFDWILQRQTGNDKVFRRALLTFGDYSMEANSSSTFFFEGGNEYYNWRRMLREEKPFGVFRAFFTKFKQEDRKNIGLVMQKYIDDYDKSDEQLFYNLVKIPQLFDYMHENRYKYDDYGNRTVLYEKTRLSAQYAEVQTFALYSRLQGDDRSGYKFGTGYFDSETSSAYIKELNGNPCQIEFKDGAFYKDGKPMDKNGSAISKVEDAVAKLQSGK